MAGWPALLLLLLLFFSLSLYLDFLPLFRLHPGRRGDLSELRPGRPGRQEGYGATGTYRVRFSSARQKKSFSKTLPGLNATLHCNVAPCHTITHTDTDTHSRRNFLQSLPPASRVFSGGRSSRPFWHRITRGRNCPALLPNCPEITLHTGSGSQVISRQRQCRLKSREVAKKEKQQQILNLIFLFFTTNSTVNNSKLLPRVCVILNLCTAHTA